MPHYKHAGPHLIEGSRSSICLIWGLAAAAASTEERIISGLLSSCCMACCHMGFCNACITVRPWVSQRSQKALALKWSVKINGSIQSSR